MKQVSINVIKWQADDGSIHATKEGAELHEAFCNGTAKECPNCKGAGSTDPYGDGRTLTPCLTCNGKGYLRRVEEWR